MIEREKNSGYKKQQEDMNLDKEIQELKERQKKVEELALDTQIQELANNQRIFNRWLIGEIAKIKEGINQLGLILSEKPEEKEVTRKENKRYEEPEEDEEYEEPKKSVKKLPKAWRPEEED